MGDAVYLGLGPLHTERVVCRLKGLLCHDADPVPRVPSLDLGHYVGVVYTYTSLAHLFSALPPPPLLGRGGGSRSLKRQAEDVYVLQGQVKVKVKGQWSMVKVKSQG